MKLKKLMRKYGYDFESDSKRIAKLMNQLEKEIIKDVGPPCKRKAIDCLTCRVWVAFDNLKLNFY